MSAQGTTAVTKPDTLPAQQAHTRRSLLAITAQPARRGTAGGTHQLSK